jgi:Fic family protein
MRFPDRPPEPASFLATLFKRDRNRILGAAPTLPDGRYLHWNELRYREPPADLSREEWWSAMRWARQMKSTEIAPMRSCYEKPFGLVDLPTIQRALHELDRVNVGEKILSALGDPAAKQDYRIRQLIEEAISSSEIEGARLSTRELARQLLRENRKPASKSERMIVNNLRAMERLRDLHLAQEELSVPTLLELHRILGEQALDVDGADGAFRKREHDVRVEDVNGSVWYTPPDALGLEERVAALLRFANGQDTPGTPFIHPILRAIVAHFWLAYEHPFRDGNGRIARAIYYWCMLRHGYEFAEFLSISGPIDRAPKAYYLAFAFCETDAEDLTYFVLHQLEVMQEAMRDLMTHLTARATRRRELSERVRSFTELNHRQRSFLEHSIAHPHDGPSIKGHGASHGVHYITASSDLADLERRGLVESRTERATGKLKRYYPTKELLRSSTGTSPVRKRR